MTISELEKLRARINKRFDHALAKIPETEPNVFAIVETARATLLSVLDFFELAGLEQ